VHHTATVDGHSAGYEMNLMISFVICHDMQARMWVGVGGMAHECQKNEGGVRRKNNDNPRGLKADKQVTTAAVA